MDSLKVEDKKKAWAISKVKRRIGQKVVGALEVEMSQAGFHD